MFVSRDRLLAKLNDAPAGTSVAVSASAGYGKSTLLRQWCDNTIEPRPLLVVTAQMNDPETFGRAIAAAMYAAMPASAPMAAMFEKASSSSPDWPNVLMPRLLATLKHQPAAVVIDDVHLITDRDLRGLLRDLIRSLPSPSRLVLAGRKLEDLHLSRLLATRRLSVIDEATLSFDTEEVRRLLTKVGGNADLADQIREQTGGWPTGVMLSSSTAPTTSASVARTRTLSHFLDEEVVSHCDETQVSFLEEAAALVPVSADLCALALKRDDIIKVARSLGDGSVPMLTISTTPTSIEMHSLLRDEMLSRLAARDSSRAAEIQLRAAEALEHQERYDDAFDYLCRIGDAELIDQFLLRLSTELILGGQTSRVQRWLNAANAIGGRNRPARILGQAAIAAAEGDTFTMLHLLDVLGALGQTEIVDGLTAHDAAQRIRRLFGLVLADDQAPTCQTAALTIWETLDTLVGAFNHYLHGRLAEAETLSFELGPKVAAWPMINSGRLTTLALVEAAKGNWAAGSAHLTAAIQITKHHHFDDDPMTFYQDGALIKFALHANNAIEAVRIATRAVSKLSRIARGGPLGRRFVTIAEVTAAHAAVGDAVSANLFLTECEQLAAWWPTSENVKTRVDAARSQVAAAANATQPYEPLSTAELRILQFLPSHFTVPQIAKRCFVAPSTVRSHILAIYRKLDVRSRAEAVDIARSRGLIDS